MTPFKNKKDLQKIVGFSGGFYPTVIPGLGKTGKTGELGVQRASRYKKSKASSKVARFIEIQGIGNTSRGKVTHEGWPLAGNPVWYKTPKSYNGKFMDVEGVDEIENHIYKQSGWMSLVKGLPDEERLKKYYESSDDAMVMLGASMAHAKGSHAGIGRNAEIIDDVIEDYLVNLSKYSGNYLQNVANFMVRKIGKELPLSFPASEITVTEGAHPQVAEEQTKQTAANFRAPDGENWLETGPTAFAVSPMDAGKVAGQTQNIDTFFNVNGKIIAADVTHSPIWKDSQHGITDVPKNLKETEVQKLLKDGEKGRHELKGRIFNYFQDQIGVYNEAVDKVRHLSHKAHGQQGEAFEDYIQRATPTQIRAPFKPAQFFYDKALVKGKGGKRYYDATTKLRRLYHAPPPSAGMFGYRGFDKGDPGFKKAVAQIQEEYQKGAEASLSASVRNVMVGIYGGYGSHRKAKPRKQIATSRGPRQVNQSAMSFVLHAIGTWAQHNGAYWNAFRVSSFGQDLVTAGVQLRMHDSGVKKYLYHKLRSIEEDVKIFNGYFTHGLMREQGYLYKQDEEKSIHDIHLAQTALQLGKQKGSFTANRVSSSETNRMSGQSQVGFSFILYNNVATKAVEKVHRALHRMFDPDVDRSKTNKQQEAEITKFVSKEAMSSGFASSLHSLQTKARNENQMNKPKYDAAHTTWPGESWITALQYFGLQQHEVGTTGKGYGVKKPPKTTL